MCRRAHPGLVAVFLLLVFGWLLNVQTEARAQSVAALRSVYVPMVLTTNALVPTTNAPAPTHEAEAITLINEQRQARGCQPVSSSAQLTTAALSHSREMAENSYFSHTGLDGSSFVQRAQRAKYQYNPSAEVIAGGQPTAAEAVKSWMNSPAHRSIILTCAHQEIGIGFVDMPGSKWRYYWTAKFGMR